MIVYLNGRFVPEEQAVVSVHDRGFLYGDGLFETIRIYSGEPFLWREHIVRMQAGAKALGIHPPLSPGELRIVLGELLRRNELSEAIARITLSRGVGPRGYSPKGADHPSLGILISPAPHKPPEFCRVVTSSFRLPARDPLAEFKHANKLVQIVARAEADSHGADEAILLNEFGHVVEGASSNIFWLRGRELCTAPLAGILPGATRARVLRLAPGCGLALREEFAPLLEVRQADGVFLTSSGVEIVEVAEWDRTMVRRSPAVQELRSIFRPAGALKT